VCRPKIPLTDAVRVALDGCGEPFIIALHDPPRKSCSRFELKLEAHAFPQRPPITGPFATSDEVEAEFERLTRLIDAARHEALRAVVTRHGIIESPAIRVVRCPTPAGLS
jgi:hypothetical protein